MLRWPLWVLGRVGGRLEHLFVFLQPTVAVRKRLFHDTKKCVFTVTVATLSTH